MLLIGRTILSVNGILVPYINLFTSRWSPTSSVGIIDPEGILNGCTINVLIKSASATAISRDSTFCLNLDFLNLDRCSSTTLSRPSVLIVRFLKLLSSKALSVSAILSVINFPTSGAILEILLLRIDRAIATDLFALFFILDSLDQIPNILRV